MSEERLSSNATLREELIATAIKFLTNPNVQTSSLQKKENFLRSKGLTDFEIKEAFERGKDLISQIPSISSKSELMFYRSSNTNKLKDTILSAVVFGAVSLGLYWAYKTFLQEYMFGTRSKQKSLDASIVELKKTLEEHITTLKIEVSKMRADVTLLNNQNNSNTVIRSQMEGLKSDIASVKGLLLSRNQFPSVTARSEPPSIPAWQIQSAQASNETAVTTSAADLDDELSRTKKGPVKRNRGERSESGGSNSSEGEAAAKNSDSSLEIIPGSSGSGGEI